ncbi:MAG: hypothetical protein JXB88_08070 [Spirochaetales bacterium]|nr:hypothetical protein [Spirochaetales bacterium]
MNRRKENQPERIMFLKSDVMMKVVDSLVGGLMEFWYVEDQKGMLYQEFDLCIWRWGRDDAWDIEARQSA